MEVFEVVKVFEVLEMPEVMRCMLLCMLVAAEGRSVCGRSWRRWG